MIGELTWSGEWQQAHQEVIAETVDRARSDLGFAFDIHEVQAGSPVRTDLVRLSPQDARTGLGKYHTETSHISVYVSDFYLGLANGGEDLELRKTLVHEVAHAKYTEVINSSGNRLLDQIVSEGIAYEFESLFDEKQDDTEKYFKAPCLDLAHMLKLLARDAQEYSNDQTAGQEIANKWFEDPCPPSPGNVVGYLVVNKLVRRGNSLAKIMALNPVDVIRMAAA